MPFALCLSLHHTCNMPTANFASQVYYQFMPTANFAIQVYHQFMNLIDCNCINAPRLGFLLKNASLNAK